MSSTMMMVLGCDDASAMIFTWLTSPALALNLSAIMKPTPSSSAILRVRFAPPASVAQQRASSGLKSGTLSLMKLPRYFSQVSSSRAACAGLKPDSAWLWRSMVTKRSHPAVTIKWRSSFGAIASPASNFLSCLAYSTHGRTTVILWGASDLSASSIMSSCISMKLTSHTVSSREQMTNTSWLATDCSNLTEISPFAKVRKRTFPIVQLRWPTTFSQRSRFPGVQKTTGGWPTGTWTPAMLMASRPRGGPSRDPPP
mmetsp:Transcript_15918/g.41137  ORF Transcript_15918/g.41137 Transcript_15918/m.41137 type:complete len:256 (+) Transcript_15918:579-1346(+)